MSHSITQSVSVPAEDVNLFDYSRENGIIGWMDCGGSNLVKINEQLPGIVRIIATTRITHPEVKARQKRELLSEKNRTYIPLVELDLAEWERKSGVFPGDYWKALKAKDLMKQIDMASGLQKKSLLNQLEIINQNIRSIRSIDEIFRTRENFGEEFGSMIETAEKELGIAEDLPVFAAGGMALMPKVFVENKFVGNVHPGLLDIYGLNGLKRGLRQIVGDGYIPPLKALLMQLPRLSSSMHLMTAEMDAGPLFMKGYMFEPNYNWLKSTVDIDNPEIGKLVGETAQELLKYIGDHVIAGATFDDLFEGMWAKHKNGSLAYNFQGQWYLAPNGISIEDHVANRQNDTPFARTQKFLNTHTKQFYFVIKQIGEQYKK